MIRKRPEIGVGAVIMNNGLLLLGQRRGAHGAGTWSCPGGHLEYGESPEDCARREVLEETGLLVDAARPLFFTNDIFGAEDKHYVTLFVLCSVKPGEPQLHEPDKCSGWQWFALSGLPSPLFLPLEHLLSSQAAAALKEQAAPAAVLGSDSERDER